MLKVIQKKWLYVFLLCLCFNTYVIASNIIFVHLGKHFLPCIFTVLKQARHLNQDCPIYLLTDKEAYDVFYKEHLDFFSDTYVSLVNMDSIKKSEEHLVFQKTNQLSFSASNFWLYASERFFYLFDFIQDQNLQHVIHLENDCMLYIDLQDILPSFENIQLAAPFQSAVGCIPCFFFIKNKESLKPLVQHILSEMHHYRGSNARIELNDMRTLASFYTEFGEAHMTALPTLMNGYDQSKRRSIYKPDNETPLTFLSKNAPLFPGYLFDAATFGVFANGNDRRHFIKNGPGAIHYRSLFNPHCFFFFWDVDSKNRPVPCLSFKGDTYRIVNMHFHSKDADNHTSYLDTRMKFPNRTLR